MKWLVLIILGGIFIMSCVDSETPPEAIPQEVPEAVPQPTPEAEPQQVPEAIPQPVPEAEPQPGLFRRILSYPWKIVKWPFAKAKDVVTSVIVDNEPKYRFVYHTYCHDMPNQFSGICVSKTPAPGRYK